MFVLYLKRNARASMAMLQGVEISWQSGVFS